MSSITENKERARALSRSPDPTSHETNVERYARQQVGKSRPLGASGAECSLEGVSSFALGISTAESLGENTSQFPTWNKKTMNDFNAFLMPFSFLRRWSYNELIPALLYFDRVTFLMDRSEERRVGKV